MLVSFIEYLKCGLLAIFHTPGAKCIAPMAGKGFDIINAKIKAGTFDIERFAVNS